MISESLKTNHVKKGSRTCIGKLQQLNNCKLFLLGSAFCNLAKDYDGGLVSQIGVSIIWNPFENQSLKYQFSKEFLQIKCVIEICTEG